MKGLSWFIAGLTLAVLGVFVVPWFVPLTAPVKGESYSFGFCNRAGVLALLVSFVLWVVGLIRTGRPANALSWFSTSPVLLPPLRQAAYEYVVLGIASVICAVAVMIWNAYLVFPYWSESDYFLSRMDLVRLGFVPYKDFQFNYGPAFLYPPIWLDQLSGGLLGSENAYALCVALTFAAGFTFLFIFQRVLNLPDRHRPWIFALTCLVWFILSMGIQYTPMRHTVLPCVLTFGCYLLQAPSRSASSYAVAAVSILAGSIACYMISPEIGVACTVGFGASAVVYFWSRRILLGVICLAGGVVSVALIMVFSLGYLFSLLSFGSGAYNFPIYPNLANVLLVASSLYVLPRMACAIWQQPSHPAAPLAAGLGAASTTLLPAAFGRCDPGHVIINGLMIFILLFPALGQFKRSFLIAWGVVFGFTFVVLGQVSYWNHYWPLWQEAFREHKMYIDNPDLVSKWSLAWNGTRSKNYARLNWDKIVPFPEIDSSVTTSNYRIAAPFGGDVMLDRYLKIRNGFVPEYFPTTRPEVFSPKDVARVVEETKANYDLLLVENSTIDYFRNNLDQPQSEAGMQDFLSGLLLFPVENKFQHKPYLPEIEVARGLLLPNMTVVSKGGGYFLLKVPH